MISPANGYAAYKNGRNVYENGAKTSANQRAVPAIVDAADADALNSS